MAHADISRFLFQPEKRYTSVRMQQGRVMLDSDWNEFERLDHELDRQMLVDILCAKGTSNDGFRITQPRVVDTSADAPATYDFAIAPGSFYLGGLRFAADESQTFLNQSDWLQLGAEAPAPPVNLEADEVRYDLVYLRGWEQCVSAVEDSELLERALGGPDTSVRVRRMQRVEILPDVADTCAEAFDRLTQQLTAGEAGEPLHSLDERTCELQSAARLSVTFDLDGLAEDPCRPAVSSGYLGADNQTMRIQLTTPNRFVWSYNNAAPLYRVQVDVADLTRVRFLTLPRDQEAQPLANQTVEIIPWGTFLPNQEKVAELQGQFFRVGTSYNPVDNSLTLADPIDQAWLDWLAENSQYWSDRNPSERQQYFYLRLWTGSGESDQPDTGFTPGTAVTIPGTGVTATFSNSGIAGDFWVLALRPNTPTEVVPWNLLESAPPAGPRQYFAPLALIRWSLANGELQPSVQDCRERFQPLCQVNGCCTVTVGDGRTSHGLFNSVEDAIAFLPPDGGKICLLPGQHQTNANLRGRRNIRITGCGVHTIVQPRADRVTDPIFQIAASQNIQLDQMTLVAHATTAIQLIDPENTTSPSQGIHIVDNDIVACIHAIEIRVNNERAGNNDIQILRNRLGILDKDTGRAAIFLLADDGLIERNRIVVVPAPNPEDPSDSRRPDDFTNDVFDPCAEPEIFYTPRFPLRLWATQTFQYIAQLAFLPTITYQAQGGIQIGGSSDDIRIIQNTIIGGYGHGIVLGHWPAVQVDGNRFEQRQFFAEQFPTGVTQRLQEQFVSTLYDLVIAENTIRSMGLSGIGVGAFLISDRIGLRVRVENLTVYRNIITRCAQQLPAEIPEALLPDMGFGGIALTECENGIIQENQITDNGRSHRDPICGIFILYGEKIDITNNRILNNGPRINFDDDVDRGTRGGIVLGISFQPLANILEDSELLSPDGIPAVKIHNNIVTQPLAQALFMIAFGPVSIVGNQFTSQGADARINPISLLAGTVFILNLGISKDLLTAALLASFRGTTSANPESFGTTVAIDPGNDDQLDTVRRLLYLPSGNILFTNNQTTLDLRTDEVNFTFSSQLLASLDDIAYNSNQSECTSLLDLVLTNTALWGVTIRTNDNRFQEGITVAFYSLFSLGLMNTATGNQATHCIFVFASPSLLVENSNQVLYPFILQNGEQIGCPGERSTIAERLEIPTAVAAPVG